MAIGDSYITSDELKAYASNITDAEHDPIIAAILPAASRAIERWCGRQFNDAGSASARVYTPISPDLVFVDDFSTTTGLIVKTDTTADATYATTISSSYYTVEPLNGVIDGRPGYPYRRIAVHSGESMPMPAAGPPSVQVTARWGWAAVPADVKQACLIEATRMFRRMFTPDGLLAETTAGVAGYAVRVPTDLDRTAQMLLAPYRASAVLVGAV